MKRKRRMNYCLNSAEETLWFNLNSNLKWTFASMQYTKHVIETTLGRYFGWDFSFNFQWIFTFHTRSFQMIALISLFSFIRWYSKSNLISQMVHNLKNTKPIESVLLNNELSTVVLIRKYKCRPFCIFFIHFLFSSLVVACIHSAYVCMSCIKLIWVDEEYVQHLPLILYLYINHDVRPTLLDTSIVMDVTCALFHII